MDLSNYETVKSRKKRFYKILTGWGFRVHGYLVTDSAKYNSFAEPVQSDLSAAKEPTRYQDNPGTKTSTEKMNCS